MLDSTPSDQSLQNNTSNLQGLPKNSPVCLHHTRINKFHIIYRIIRDLTAMFLQCYFDILLSTFHKLRVLSELVQSVCNCGRRRFTSQRWKNNIFIQFYIISLKLKYNLFELSVSKSIKMSKVIRNPKYKIFNLK